MHGVAAPIRELDIETRSIVLALVVVGGVLLAAGLAASLPKTIVFTALGVFLALALDPIVTAVRRRAGVGRAPAVAIVLAGFAIALGLLIVFVVPPAARQSRDLGDELPTV